MSQTINKAFLKNHRFGNNPHGWALESKSFYDSATLLLATLKTMPQQMFISIEDIHKNSSYLKTTCFLLSISVELSLKAIYSNQITSDNKQKKVESFSHNIKELNSILIELKVLDENELCKESLELGYILLSWYGRYHKPLEKNRDAAIRAYFEDVHNDPNMVKPKFEINIQTTNMLKILAEHLLEKIKINPASISYLLYTPF